MKTPTARNPGVCFSASSSAKGGGTCQLVRDKRIFTSHKFDWTERATFNSAGPPAYTDNEFFIFNSNFGTNWIRSTDGINWTSGNAKSTAGFQLYCTIKNGNTIVIQHAATGEYSTDNGSTWTPMAFYSNEINSCRTGNSDLSMLVTFIVNSTTMYYSTNLGQSWSTNTLPFTPVRQGFLWCYDKFVWCNYGSNPSYYSLDGLNWVSFATPGNSIEGVSVMNGSDRLLIGGGYDGAIYTIDCSKTPPVFTRNIVSRYIGTSGATANKFGEFYWCKGGNNVSSSDMIVGNVFNPASFLGPTYLTVANKNIVVATGSDGKVYSSPLSLKNYRTVTY